MARVAGLCDVRSPGLECDGAAMSEGVPQRLGRRGPPPTVLPKMSQSWENLCVTSRSQLQRGGRPQSASGPRRGTPHRRLKSLLGGLGTLASLPGSQIPLSASLGQDRQEAPCEPGTPRDPRAPSPRSRGTPSSICLLVPQVLGDLARERRVFLTRTLGTVVRTRVPMSPSPAGRPPCTGLRSELGSSEPAPGPTHPSLIC